MSNDLEFVTPQIKKIKKTFKEFYALEKGTIAVDELDVIRKEAKLDILESLFYFLFDSDIMEEKS